MNGDRNFEESGQTEAHFTLQIIWITFSLSVFASIIVWLIWRIVVGGGFELALGIVVLGVLICIMLTGIGTAVVIVMEGRSKKSEFKPVPAQPKAVSSDRWAILDPFERRGPL